MSNTTAYLVQIRAAQRLASLIGIKSDLERVLWCCERMMERYSGPHLKKDPFDIVGFTTPLDFDDWETLSTTVCVAYARCFKSGIRNSLRDEDLNSEDHELQELHSFLLDLRDKHVAHSVNPFERNQVTVHIDDHFTSSQEIVSVTPSHTRAVGLTIGEPATVARLAKWWLEFVRREMASETERLLAVLRATPLSELKTFGTQGPDPPRQRRDVRRRRERP
jgi:hypothetical protein